MSDPSSPLSVASSLEFSIISDTPKGSLTICDLSLPSAPLGELEDEDAIETDDSFHTQCGIFVESDDTFTEDHSLNKPFDGDFIEVKPPEELIDLMSVESSLDLAPTPPISPLSPSLSILHPSVDLPESTFVESETFVLDSHCSD